MPSSKKPRHTRRKKTYSNIGCSGLVSEITKPYAAWETLLYNARAVMGDIELFFASTKDTLFARGDLLATEIQMFYTDTYTSLMATKRHLITNALPVVERVVNKYSVFKTHHTLTKAEIAEYDKDVQAFMEVCLDVPSSIQTATAGLMDVVLDLTAFNELASDYIKNQSSEVFASIEPPPADTANEHARALMAAAEIAKRSPETTLKMAHLIGHVLDKGLASKESDYDADVASTAALTERLASLESKIPYVVKEKWAEWLNQVAATTLKGVATA